MRRVADGTAFEKEFAKEFEDSTYVKRLRTPNTGYAGIREPADFIVIADNFNYVELKETAGDKFSIYGMEQYDMMRDFVQEFRKRWQYLGTAMRYWLIVNFISYGVIKVIGSEDAEALAVAHKTLTPNTKTAMTFHSLEELKGANLF